jgi:predicted nucleic acid-binding protein
MIAIDACVLSLLIYDKSGVPNDFKTGKPIEFARQRVNGLIQSLEDEAGSIVIPTPALSEALCVVAPNCQQHVDELESQSCFRVRPFGTRAAIEVAVRVKTAKDAGDKKEGLRHWDKVKYDRQIIAIAKVEGATKIYSTDKDIHDHGNLWGIEVLNVSDLPIPQHQGVLFEREQPKQIGEEIPNERETETPVDAPSSVPGGDSIGAGDTAAEKAAAEEGAKAPTRVIRRTTEDGS